MNQDLQLLEKRFAELSDRAGSRGIYFFSGFLTMAELGALQSMRRKLGSFSTFGGYEGAERQIACFGSEEELGYPPEFPISCVEISPKSAKFSEALTHRDFLGAVMSLGIVREKLGDIVIKDGSGYLFCLDTSARYIAENLESVRRTSVKCRVLLELPALLAAEPQHLEVNTASQRVDALVAAVYGLSRTAAAKLFEEKLVYVNSLECSSPGRLLEQGDVVSVRHRGRFRFCGVQRVTKKGRLFAAIDKY